MSSIKKKIKWSRKGVSEIIANILILGITVTLFSSIMYFVAAMPPPQNSTYADFSMSPRFVDSAHMKIDLNITHIGGQELANLTTRIVLTLNNVQSTAYISNSNPSIGTTWTTGETWKYAMPYTLGQNPYGNLTVMVIDTSKNNVVWSSDVAGGTVGAGDYPIIGTRGTSPSPAYVGNTIFFFATVTDPDGDLNTNGVFIDLSTVMGASYNHVQMKASPGGSVFETTGYTALQSWNGATVIINATDLHGRYEIGLLKLSILGQSGGGGNNYGPYNNYSAYLVNGTYPPDANGGESGGLQGSSGMTFYYIREASNPSVITHNFTSGQGVLIELYSNALENLAIANTFQLINPLTGGSLTPPSSTDAFGYGGIYGAFYRYTFNFTAPTQSGMYPFQIFLRDNIGTCININDYIRVNQPSYPQLQTYVLNAATNSLIKTSSFNNTDTLVLKIVTKDTDNSMLGLVTGNLQVNDFTGKYIINKLPAVADAYPSAPAYSAPLSSIYKTSPGAGSASRVPDSSTSGVYTLYVKLLDTYQGIWLPNRNSYTLIMTLFSDTGNPGTAETYYDLSIQFNVTAPVNSADIAVSVGSGSYTWSSSGASWSQNSLAWFQGGAATGEWAENIIASNTYNGPVGLDLTDVNHDGYTDLIVGFQDQTVSVAWYEDMNAAGTEWSTTPYTIAPATDALPGIQNAGGTDRGNANEDSTVYATAGGGFQTGYYSQNEIPAAIATGDFDGLGDTGVVVSYVHPVVYTTATSSAGANYANSFGMYFNRGIYVYWNIMNGATGITSSALNGTLSFLSGSGDYGANGNYNTACVGLAVADLNHDGYPDIVGVYNDGTTRVWLNQYGVLNGNTTYREQNAFGANSLITNLPVVPGAHPWDNPQGQDGRMAQVAVMDMNNDGYLDIVRTSTVGTGTGSGDANVYILYTEPSISSDSQAPFSETYSYGTTNGVNLFTNLVAVDNLYENITETQTTVSDVGLPNGYSTLNAADASPSNPNANSPYFTSGVQGVAKGGTTLTINGFALNSSNSGKNVASASLSMKYIVWPTPATNTQNPTNVGYAYGSGYGTETGALSALTAVDNSYENLTESQQLTGTITGTPAKLSSDNTGATLSNLTASDGLYYAVQRASSGHNIMNISYSISSSNSAYAVNTATLWLEYYTANSGGGFTSSNLQWSLDGKTWTTITSVTTHASQTSMTYNLAINGVNTYAKLNNLIIRYQGGSMGTVNWNALLVNVTFVKTYALDWSWQIVNGASYATHSLTVNARCFDNSESFTLEYSVDNSTWQGQTTIFSTTAANYVWTLQAQSGSYYYLRVVDNNQGPSDTSASTLCINMISMAQTEAPYVGNGDIQVSFNSGASWIHTGITPLASDTAWATKSVDLVALKLANLGTALTYSDLANLQVKFVNNDPSTGATVRTVWFDVLNEQVTYYNGYRTDWTWIVNNDVNYPYHSLTVNAYCKDTNDSYTLMYSTDDIHWQGMTTVSSTTPQNYTWTLPAQTGSYYYVRVVNNNQTAAHQTSSTLCVNMIKVLHYPANVYWPSSQEKIVTIFGLGSAYYITGIALGDVGKDWGDFKPDGLPDIVICTSRVGGGDATHTLYVSYQSAGGGGFDQPIAIATNVVAADVGSNSAIYQTEGVRIGDFNGDGYADIAMILGFQPGRTGSGVPSLFIYLNRPDLGMAQFQESTVNALSTSQSAINIAVGYINLDSILLPFLGVIGVIAGEAVLDRKERRRK